MYPVAMPCPPRQGHDVIFIKFRAPDCRDCQAKPACTKAKRRTISVQTKEIYDFLKQKRAFQKTQDFRDLYRQRAGVEGTISQAAWVLGMRQSRYRGLEKTHLQNVLTAAAINLTRAVNWITEIPLAETRTSRFGVSLTSMKRKLTRLMEDELQSQMIAFNIHLEAKIKEHQDEIKLDSRRTGAAFHVASG